MAATLARQDSTDKWQELERRDEQKVFSGNRVRSKPAKDAVIHGILSSLQTLDSPHAGSPFDVEDSQSLSRPFSSESMAGAPSVPFTVGRHALERDDDDFDDESAVGPVIPITRKASRRTSGGAHVSPVRSVNDSKRASLSSSQKERLMSHSAKKQSSESDSPNATRRLRRVSSHDTLRQAQPDHDFQVDADFILNGLGSLAAVPDYSRHPRSSSPKLLGSARQYLDQQFELFDRDRSRSPSAGPSTPAVRRRSSRPSPITDSIPTRTSSLRQASNSPVASRRIPRRGIARASSVQKTISEDWADLGEEDDTVRRILELRKKRETRLMDEEISISDTIDTHSMGRNVSQNRKTTSPEPRLRPTTSTSQSSTSSAAKAYKVLGINSFSLPLSSSIDDVHSGNGDGADHIPDSVRASTSTATTANPISSGTLPTATEARRPFTAKSILTIDPPISLDYSYAQAIDALQGAEQESQQRGELEKPRGMTTIATLQPIPHRRTTSQSSANHVSPLRPKKQRGRSNYSDLTEEIGKRDRRKSMSDARGAAEAERRDSVEDTVLDYLRAPRLSQKIADSQTGRIISFSEVGDPKGAAVLVCVGMGLTRYVTAFFDELATTLRLRLITIDRPGVGESQPYNDKSGPLMWPADVTAVCDHLGITKFGILAHSAGAVYALATALILSNMVRGSIHLLAPWIPPSQLEAAPYSAENTVPAGTLPRSQRFLRVLPAPFLKAANSSWMNMGSLQPAKRKMSSSPNGISGLGSRNARTSSESPNRCLPRRPTTSGGPRPENPRRESMMLMDRFIPETNPMENFPITGDDGTDEKRRESLFLSATATPTDPNFTYASVALNAAEHTAKERQGEFSSRLTQRTWEYAIKDSNPATDLLICLERHREIGFKYTDITRRVVITHGSEDKRVPVGNVKWLAEQMNRAARAKAAVTKESLVHDPDADPGCVIRILEGEDHGLMASPIIMGDVLTEIASYFTAEERGRHAV